MSNPVRSRMAEIKEKLSQIHHLLPTIESARLESEDSLDELQNVKKNKKSEEKHDPIGQRLLQDTVNKAHQCTKKEEKSIREALENIYEIKCTIKEQRLEARKAGNKEVIRRVNLMKQLLTDAQTLPLYVSKSTNSRPPNLCGRIPAKLNHIAKYGDLVAAFVKNNRNEENWILAEIRHYDEYKNRYEVDDIDDEDNAKYKVSRNLVIPLPLMRANPETDAKALFSSGDEVLALFPQTTCFYRAQVYLPPESALDSYKVLFENEANESFTVGPYDVPQRYVLNNTERRKKKSQSSAVKNADDNYHDQDKENEFD